MSQNKFRVFCLVEGEEKIGCNFFPRSGKCKKMRNRRCFIPAIHVKNDSKVQFHTLMERDIIIENQHFYQFLWQGWTYQGQHPTYWTSNKPEYGG